jgi:Mn2+/Fe2+ NRAMP family transporter
VEKAGKKNFALAMLGPGLLVAATGVGAGDLATASIAGSELGVAILWAVLVGAFLKFVITEGLARYQLATDLTLLEGSSRHFGRPFQILFLLYLLPWSYFVGGALISACGVTAHAVLPLFDDPVHDKRLYGVLHSALALTLVLFGGYRLFEKLMRVMIGLMFFTVVFTVLRVDPDWAAVFRGMAVPLIPRFDSGGPSWTVALMGGVGGTLTVLCYGYWIREEGIRGYDALRTCRIDLATGYVMTAIFGLALVIIGSQIVVEGSGATLIVNLANRLGDSVGPWGYWLFLVGAWGAVFSSLFGVLQSVPYIYADFVATIKNEDPVQRAARVSTRSKTYMTYLVLLAAVPCLSLFADFKAVQKIYAVVGACFMPFLAVVLLYLNGSAKRVGLEFKNGWATNVILAAALLFFCAYGLLEVIQRF